MSSRRPPPQLDNKQESAAKDDMNGFGDFDDLPSVKSDAMSGMESASDANSLKTPAKMNRTPRNAAAAADESST